MLTANETLKGHIHVEYWGNRTSASIFRLAEALTTTRTGGKVTARSGWEAPDENEGGDESSFTFDIEATPEEFRSLISHLRTLGIRVKEAQLGEGEED